MAKVYVIWNQWASHGHFVSVIFVEVTDTPVHIPFVSDKQQSWWNIICILEIINMIINIFMVCTTN